MGGRDQHVTGRQGNLGRARPRLDRRGRAHRSVSHQSRPLLGHRHLRHPSTSASHQSTTLAQRSPAAENPNGTPGPKRGSPTRAAARAQGSPGPRKPKSTAQHLTAPKARASKFVFPGHATPRAARSHARRSGPIAPRSVPPSSTAQSTAPASSMFDARLRR